MFVTTSIFPLPLRGWSCNQGQYTLEKKKKKKNIIIMKIILKIKIITVKGDKINMLNYLENS